MNTFLNSALALAVASSLGLAGTSSSSDWASTDKDLSLAATLSKAPAGGPEIGALIRSSLDFSSGDGFEIGDEDLQGVRFGNAKVFLQGQLGDYWWRLSFDFASQEPFPFNSPSDNLGGASLEDAYARWNVGDNFAITMGQFKAPTVRSANVSDGSLLFIDRTQVGHAFDSYDPGVMVGGNYEAFSWDVALQNGADGASEDYALSARGEYHWNNGAGNMEGGYGMGDGTHGSFGVSYWDDNDDAIDGKVFSGDGSVSFSRFTVAAEISSFDEEAADALLNYGYDDDATPWSLVGAFMIRDNELELAVRFQDADDVDDSTILTGGLNWYKGGHNCKWQVNISDYKSDNDTIEGTIFQLGLTLGADS